MKNRLPALAHRFLQIRACLLCLPLCSIACTAPNVTESQAPYNLALEAWQNDELSVAADHLTTAIEKSGNVFFTSAHLKRGELNLERARRLVADAGDDKPQVRAWLSEAHIDFARILEEEELADDVRIQTLLLQGKAFRSESNHAGAVVCFEQVLELPTSPTSDPHRLQTHEGLGDILLERAIATRRAMDPPIGSPVDRTASRNLQNAQRHFAACLKISSDDPDCNRGKGICLFFREMAPQAIHYLEKATSLSQADSSRAHEAHFYLALALEEHRGIQHRSLEHYRRAFVLDKRRSYLPLYRHVVDVLPKYQCEDMQFRAFFDQLLSFQGEEIEYWALVEDLSESLINEKRDKTRQLGLYGRALARARSGNIDSAVTDAIQLSSTYAGSQDPEFLNQLMVVFPRQPARLDYYYGTGKTLFETQHHKKLDQLFESEIKGVLATTRDDDKYHALCHLLNGKNIVALWKASDATKESVENTGEPAIQQSLDREKFLSEARDAFQLCLTLPEHDEIRLDLGEVQELLQSFTASYINYASVAQRDPSHTEAYRRILRLHAQGLLPAKKEHVQAWNTLKTYTGGDQEIRLYLRETAQQLRRQSELYCQSCGRKGLDGESRCHSCGMLLLRPSVE